jgi:integrase
MAKRFSLEPRKSWPVASPWCVNIPARISESGKRERKFFATKSAAETYGKSHRIRIENYGTAATLLTPGQLEEAAKAFEQLRPFKATLNEAVAAFMARRNQDGRSVTFKKLFELFAEAKARRSPSYRRELKYTVPRFEPLHNKLVSRVTPAQIDEQTAAMTPSARNAKLRVLRAAFNFGIKRDYLTRNPIDKLDFESLPISEVEILSPKEAAALMTAAAESPDLLAYHALGMFAGIRPDELLRLNWSDVDLVERHILIRSEVAKNHRRRIIEIEPNLAAWLRICKSSGAVTPAKNLRSRLRKIRWNAAESLASRATADAAAHLYRWTQDIMRHSFASYWLALHGDINKLTIMMGHANATMLWKHYHKAAKKTDAEKYSKIGPPSKRKILEFAAA